MRFGHKALKIQHIFISHLHGDHYLGLMGLISTMNLLGRQNSLYLYGPPGLAEIITIQLNVSRSFLQFRIHFQELNHTGIKTLVEEKWGKVEAFPMKHRIPCYGYKISESPKAPRLKSPPKPEGMSLADYATLRSGESVFNEKQQIRYSFEEWMIPAPVPASYAYCSDTIYDTDLLPFISGVSVLYHESTFLEELSSRAKETYHSTAAQAAMQAKEAGVQTLVLGHYSSRYKEVEAFRIEASAVFPNTLLAYDGLQFNVSDGK